MIQFCPHNKIYRYILGTNFSYTFLCSSEHTFKKGDSFFFLFFSCSWMPCRLQPVRDILDNSSFPFISSCQRHNLRAHRCRRDWRTTGPAMKGPIKNSQSRPQFPVAAKDTQQSRDLYPLESNQASPLSSSSSALNPKLHAKRHLFYNDPAIRQFRHIRQRSWSSRK